MAQLIKLEDCTSRYHFDMHRYPSQFARLKKERWQQLRREWMEANRSAPYLEEETGENWFEEAERSVLSQAIDRLKSLTPRRKKDEFEDTPDVDFSFYKDKSRFDIIEIYFEELFQAQLRWASTSLLEESRLNPKYRYDQRLRYLLRELPDNYFIMYYPIFSVRRAPVEMDVLIISPVEIICMTILEGKRTSVFETSSGRFWNEYVDEQKKRRVNPILSLNRMAAIIRDILGEKSLPVRYVVFSPASLIDHRASGMKAEMIDHRSHDRWLEKMKNQPSPIKNVQLKTAERLLEQAVTISFRRDDLLNTDEEDRKN